MIIDLPPVSVGVGLREYVVAPYRDRVRAGVVRFNITNFGEDRHDLVVRRRGRTYARSPLIRAGARYSLRVRLRRRGTYTLVCTVADHSERGMRARVYVNGSH